MSMGNNDPTSSVQNGGSVPMGVVGVAVAGAAGGVIVNAALNWRSAMQTSAAR